MSETIASDVGYCAPPDGGAGQGRANYGPPGVGGSGGAAGGYDGSGFPPFGRGGGGNAGGRGGDRWAGGRGAGGGGRGGGHREGDWVCASGSCGNVNFSRRTECNKCGAARPPGGQPGSYNSGRGGAGNYGNQSSGRAGTGYGMQSGRSGGYSVTNNNGNQSGPAAAYGSDNDYVQNTPGSGGYHTAPGYGGNEDQSVSGGNYGGRPRVTQGGRGFGERSNFGGQPGNIYNNSSGYPGSGGPRISESNISQQGVGNMEPRVDYVKENSRPSSLHGASDAAPSVKQCDENCGDLCDNSRIYISELPLDVTSDELRELFGGIGQVARIKQKRGYKDQWPWNIKIYRDEAGKNKGDAVLSYEDPSAAHSAGAFFNDYSMRGHNIKVTMAEKYAPKPTGYGHGSGGGYGGDRGYGGGGGPDRHAGGGYHSRPY